ncbi:MAG TPA: hypothetical protein DEF01_06545 [Gemmatimonadetes bacterium]|nr:hypothetical protein [Gemmatimonadota bacterium]
MTRLSGKVVAVTRSTDDRSLAPLLAAEGAQVVHWPTIKIQSTSDPERLKTALGSIESYNWIVFTSQHSVASVISLVPVQPTGIRVAAVGGGTAEALSKRQWRADVIGDGGSADLAKAIKRSYPLVGVSVLFPAGNLAAPTLQNSLEAAGAEVTRVEAYETKTLSVDPTRILSDLNTGVDVVTFASPSAVETMANAMDDGWPKLLKHCSVVAIGATTRDALLSHGALKNAVTMENPATLAGLVEATVSSFISTPIREHEQ